MQEFVPETMFFSFINSNYNVVLQVRYTHYQFQFYSLGHVFSNTVLHTKKLTVKLVLV